MRRRKRRNKIEKPVINLTTEDVDNLKIIISILTDYSKHFDIKGITYRSLNKRLSNISATRLKEEVDYLYENNFIVSITYPFSNKQFWIVPEKMMPRTDDCAYLERTLHWFDSRTTLVFKEIIKNSRFEAEGVVFDDELKSILEETDKHSFLFVLDILLSEGFVLKVRTQAGWVYKLILDYNLQDYNDTLVDYIITSITEQKPKGD